MLSAQLTDAVTSNESDEYPPVVPGVKESGAGEKVQVVAESGQVIRLPAND